MTLRVDIRLYSHLNQGETTGHLEKRAVPPAPPASIHMIHPRRLSAIGALQPLGGPGRSLRLSREVSNVSWDGTILSRPVTQHNCKHLRASHLIRKTAHRAAGITIIALRLEVKKNQTNFDLGQALKAWQHPLLVSRAGRIRLLRTPSLRADLASRVTYPSSMRGPLQVRIFLNLHRLTISNGNCPPHPVHRNTLLPLTVNACIPP